MEPFDALTETDKDTFLRYIEYAAPTTPIVPLSTLLGYWNEAKQSLFDAFGGKLTLSKEVSFHKAQEDLAKDWNQMLRENSTLSAAYSCISSAIEKKAAEIFPVSQEEEEYNKEHPWCFVKRPDEYYDLRSFIYNQDYLLTNSYTGRTFTIPTKDGKKIKVQKGCHLMPTLRKICVEFDISLEDYETVRLTQSQLLNNAFCQGTLTLSISPIDFITMSDNDCGWDSCMCWIDHDGEYRKGTIEMMNSPCVLVAYLEASEPFILHPYRGNPITLSNKRWRQLVIANEDVIVGNRNYPYASPELESIVLSWVRELLGETHYENKVRPFCNNRRKEDNPGGKEFLFDFFTDFMYNDIYDWRNAYFSTDFFDKHPSLYRLNYSGSSECMRCGKPMVKDEDDSAWVVCGNCNGAIRCSCCNSYILDGDERYSNSNGETFCQYCVNESDDVEWCSCCDEPHFVSDFESMEFISDDMRYSVCVSACRDCFPSFGEFGPTDEDGIYHRENFTDDAENFVREVGY